MNRKPHPGFFGFRLRLWGLLTSSGFIACAATILGFLGRVSWFTDLFSHFRMQYLLGLAGLALIFALGRRWGMAVLFLGFAGINLWTVAPFYLPPPSSAEGASQPLGPCCSM